MRRTGTVKINIFIGWSGSRSKLLAQVLRDWLPKVVQRLQPWLSSTDIGRGARWPAALARELANAKFGLICLTEENLRSPWILFEAGALSRSIQGGLVCPLLLGLEPSALTGPLSQFQAVQLTYQEILALLKTLNSHVGTPDLDDTQLTNVFDRWWPDLEIEIQRLSSMPPEPVTLEYAVTSAQLDKIYSALNDLHSRLENASLNIDSLLSVAGPQTIEEVRLFSSRQHSGAEGQQDSIARLIDVVDILLQENDIDPKLAWRLAELTAIVKDEREDIKHRLAAIVELSEFEER